MAILKVLHFPDERLRLKASIINEISPEISDIAKNMLETMYAEGGIGLAATQVNIQKRIVVIDLSESKNKPIILINPEILKLEIETCLLLIALNGITTCPLKGFGYAGYSSGFCGITISGSLLCTTANDG